MTRIVRTKPDPAGAPHITEVRLHDEGDTKWWCGFVVTEFDEGRLLKVSLLLVMDGRRPPGAHWFRTFALTYFPRAELVGAERKADDGAMQTWERRFRGA